MLGTTIDGKYRILRLLGQGGMGAVYEATHMGTGRRVALKVITGEIGISQDAIARFQREARAAGVIESQHIVQVLDTGVDRDLGVPFMVMEYLTGADVQQLLEQLGAFPPDLALRIAGQACSGLQKAHEAGVVHRDIKPANLFVARRDDGDSVVRLLDFGIAKVKMDQMLGSGDHGFTRTGSMLGSPLYMSPEQAMGLKTVDQRTDIWSLGAVLYEVLSGRTPHFGKDTLGQLIMAICSAPPEPIQSVAPWIAPEVSAVVHRALRLDPAQRYQSAAEMREAIRALLPSGFNLSEAMLTPLPPGERRVVARLHVQTDPGSSAPLPVVGTMPVAGSAGAAATTGNPSFSSTRHEAPRSNGKLFLGLGVLVVALAGTGAWFRTHQSESVGPAASASSAPSASATELSPGATTSATVLPPVPASRVARLLVAPPEAVVDVDGKAVAISDGGVDISGPLGSVHSVHAAVGTRQVSEQISIAETGAVPGRIDVPPSASGSPSRPPRASATAKPAPATPPFAPTVTPTAAPAATPKTPAPKPTGPTLQKQFG